MEFGAECAFEFEDKNSIANTINKSQSEIHKYIRKVFLNFYKKAVQEHACRLVIRVWNEDVYTQDYTDAINEWEFNGDIYDDSFVLQQHEKEFIEWINEEIEYGKNGFDTLTIHTKDSE